MRTTVLVTLACGTMAIVGCQAAGQIPGVAPSFYAYTFFNGEVSEVFQFPPAFVENSCMQAMADLGFKDIERCQEGPVVVITARSPEGQRPVRITIAPQNAMTMFRVRIGCYPLGDEPLSKALIDRIALNYGALPRTIIPIEPTLGRRGPMNIPAGPPTAAFGPTWGPYGPLPMSEPVGPATPTAPPVAPATIVPVPSEVPGPFARPDGAGNRADSRPSRPADPNS